MINKECLQFTFKSNDSVTIADIEWYRFPVGRYRMSKGMRCNRSRTSSHKQVMGHEKQSGENRLESLPS